jgi:3-carboxy-cis,cis-muconate cycloisomerase
MSASPFDHPFLSGLLGDEEVASYFTAGAEIRAMLSFETALAKAEAAHGIVPQEAAKRIAEVCSAFAPDIQSLRATTATDGVVIPGLIKQLREAIGGDAAAWAHFGATSQDVIDSSLMMRLKSIGFLFTRRLATLIETLDGLDDRFGAQPLMGYTRMQAAIAITVSDRLRSWRTPINEYGQRLTEQSYPLQFGGAAGTLDKLGAKGAVVRTTLAQDLGLKDEPQWHNQRARIADLAGLLSLITGSLGKLGQDVALLAQAGTEIELAGGGASSAMTHKQNPVVAETLVALARFNAGQISAIHHSMVHEQDRSGSAWTLEWLILPSMVMATAASLRLANEMASNIVSLGTSCDLDRTAFKAAIVETE